MEIFENRNNFAGNSFQFVVMSTRDVAIPAEMPFIIWLQFNRVKWILRKVGVGCFFVGRVSRPRARVAFFYCQKKATKENHLDLRSKNPLARGEKFHVGRLYHATAEVPPFLSDKRTVPPQLSAWRCRAPLPGATVWFCALPFLAIIKSRPSRRPGGWGRCALRAERADCHAVERSGTSALGVRQSADWLAMTPHPSTLRVATFPSRGRQFGACDSGSANPSRGRRWTRCALRAHTSTGATRHRPLKGKAGTRCALRGAAGGKGWNICFA